MNAVDELLQAATENLKSQLFGLDKIENVRKKLIKFQNARLSAADQQLYRDIKKQQADDESYRAFIQRWASQSRLFETKVRDTVKDKIRQPYSFRTHKQTYHLPGQYFHCDLADMRVFNNDKRNVRRNYCIVLVDGVSNMTYLRASRKKTAPEILSGLQHLFADIKRQETVYLQTDNGTEFFNNAFYEWCKRAHIEHFASKNLKKAYLAENAIRRLKEIYQQLRKKGKLNDWVTELPNVEERMNSKERAVSGITPEELNRNDTAGEALRMLDLFKSQQQTKNTFKYNNLTRVENEKMNKKMEILKPLKVGTKVYVQKFRTDPRLQFAKATTNMISAWNTSRIFKIVKVTVRKDVVNTFYSPPYLYKVRDLSAPYETLLLKREDLNPVNKKDIYYRNLKEYETELYDNLIL